MTEESQRVGARAARRRKTFSPALPRAKVLPAWCSPPPRNQGRGWRLYYPLFPSFNQVHYLYSELATHREWRPALGKSWLLRENALCPEEPRTLYPARDLGCHLYGHHEWWSGEGRRPCHLCCQTIHLHDTIMPGMGIIKGKWSLMRQDIIPCGLMERTLTRKFPVNLDGVIFSSIHVQLPVHIQQE